MSRVHMPLVVIALLSLLASAARCAADEPPSIDALAPLIGQWRIESKWLGSDEPLEARLVCEWGPGKKFLISRTFVSPIDGSPEYERYHEIFGIEDGKLLDHGFSFDGKSYVREFHLDAGKVLKSQWKLPAAADPAAPAFTARQELEFAGDALRWRIWLEREGEKPLQIMDGTWAKDQSSRAPGK